MQLLVLAVVITACNRPAPISTFDLEKAKGAILEANQKFMDAVSKADSAGTAVLYHSQAIIMAPNFESVVGADKIISFFGGAMKMGITSTKLRSDSIWGNEDNLIEEGSYEIGDKNGTSVDKGKYIVIWKKALLTITFLLNLL